ncbi:MAG: insulinase family protein [Acidobacteria bacterium]|nr:insulinase family protein [Acidobacteriota bacterium]
MSYDRLLNGLLIVVVEDHREPVVYVRLLSKYGAAFDLQGKSGTACFMAESLMAAIDDRSKPSNARWTEGVECDQDHVALWLRAARPDAVQALRYLASRVTDPEFTTTSLARAGASEPSGNLGGETFERLDGFIRMMLYPRHPYGRSVRGGPGDRSSITTADLSRHFRQFFIANHSVLLVAGDVDRESIVTVLRPGFGPMRKGEVTPSSFVFSAPTGGPRVHFGEGGAGIVGVALGTTMVEKPHPDFLPLTLLDRIVINRLQQSLGALGKDGMPAPRLKTVLKEGNMPGYWEALLEIQASEAPKALAMMLDTCRSMGETAVPLPEIETARQALLGEFSRDLATLPGLVGFLADIELHRLGRDWIASYPSRLAQVGADDLLRIGRAFFKPEHFVAVLLGDVPPQAGELLRLGVKRWSIEDSR